MRTLGRLAVAGPLALVLGSSASAALQTEYDPRREDLSALAAGDAQHPIVMVLALLAFAAGAAALGVLLGQVLPRSESADVGRVLVLLLAAGTAASAVLRNDCSTELPTCTGRAFTWHHYGHDLAGVMVMLLLVACPLVLAAAFQGDADRARLAPASRAAGVLATTFLSLYLVTGDLWPSQQGILQRLSMAPTLVWMVAMALALGRVPGRGPEAVDASSVEDRVGPS